MSGEDDPIKMMLRDQEFPIFESYQDYVGYCQTLRLNPMLSPEDGSLFITQAPLWSNRCLKLLDVLARHGGFTPVCRELEVYLRRFNNAYPAEGRPLTSDRKLEQIKSARDICPPPPSAPPP